MILDSSALIALLRNEPGAEKVATRASDALIAATNLVEVGDNFVRHGVELLELQRAVADLKLEVVPVDAALAMEAAALFLLTRSAGLSLADRTCLALAKREQKPALTADRVWLRIADAIGVEVELIR